MKALVQAGYEGLASLSLDGVAMPVPGKNDVRVRVLACGANASDWEFATGTPAYARIYGARRPYPRILGSDVVGVIDAVGANVRLAVGTRVVGDTFGTFGGFAEYAVAKADQWVPVPDEIPDDIAAALPQSGVIAAEGMEGVSPGARVLINGAGGGSGPLAIQMAKVRGAHVTAVDNATKADVMAASGADVVLDYAQTDFAQSLDETWDVILDLWGTRKARDIAPVLAQGGRYMLVGGPMRVIGSITLAAITRRYGRYRRMGVLSVHQGPEHLPGLMRQVMAGELAPKIGATVPLDEAPKALARMARGDIPGKLIIRVGEPPAP